MEHKLRYTPGDVLLIPLANGNKVIGVISRVAHKELLGYYFAPLHGYHDLPSAEELNSLRAEHAILVCISTDMGLRYGEWKIVTKLANWKSEEWPIPSFSTQDPIINALFWKTIYNEKLKEIKRQIITEQEASRLPINGLSGSLAVEIKLSKLLKIDRELVAPYIEREHEQIKERWEKRKKRGSANNNSEKVRDDSSNNQAT